MRTGLGGGNVNGLGGGWRAHSKPCDSCKTVAAALFCRADSAFLCLVCDDRIHAANKLASRHARVWVCEVCEHAPASVTCKADAAALCASCDADIHSANPLARRHERVPVVPFLDSAAAALRSSCELDVFLTEADGGTGACAPPDDEIVPQWVLPSPRVDAPKVVEADEVKCGDVLLNVMDPYFDFDYGFPNPGSDGLVPVQVKPDPFPVNPSPEKGFDIDFCRSKFTSFGYPAQSIGQSVSSSSQDFGVVPDGTANTMSDMSHSFAGSIGCSITDPSTNTTPVIQATQLCGVDREARVLRYKEKRKNRKFEKTIRYASRKAYAETRPRIKGRFAKRTDSEPQLVDNIYSSSPAVYFGDNDFGVVPTF